MLPVHSEFRRLHVGAHQNAALQVRDVVLALRSSPTVLRGHLQMVALGGTREALCRPVLSGLLVRRIPCCLDETKPEGSITVGGGDAIAEPGPWPAMLGSRSTPTSWPSTLLLRTVWSGSLTLTSLTAPRPLSL
jgi:hypothetical protein